MLCVLRAPSSATSAIKAFRRRSHKCPHLINQILLPHNFKLLQLLLPILRNPSRVSARQQCIVCGLIEGKWPRRLGNCHALTVTSSP